MSLNIVIVSAVFPPEPVVSASLSKDIAFELAKENKVTVLCPNPTRPHGFNFTAGVGVKDYKVVRLNSFTCSESKIFCRFRESYSFGKHCFKYIADNHKNIDLIYANTWPLFAQYFTVKAAKKYNIPVTIHVQDMYPESLSNKLPVIKHLGNIFLLPIDKYVLVNAYKVIAISNKMKNYLVKTRKIESGKIEVVQNWQDEEAFINYETSNNLNLTAKKPFTFMYLGNIGPVAGIELLIEAFTSINLLSSRLVIAGSGSMKDSLEKMVKNKKVENIEFWSVPDGKVPEIQSHADVLLLPIKKGAATSSIPSKLPAYMFSKKPILALVDKDTVTYNAILEADCGWLSEPGNLENLIEKILEILHTDQLKLKKLGDNGYRFSLKYYSKKTQLNKLLKLLK